MASYSVMRLPCQRWILASFLFYSFTFAQSAGTDAPGNGTDTNDGPPSTDPSVAAENEAGAGGGSTGMPKSTLIIIGVVVSVVVVLAVAVGVYFFISKKRSFDRREKAYEALNALRSDPNYQAKARKYQEFSLRKNRRASPRRKQEVSKMPTEDIKPVLPTYDPSSFHRHHSSIDSIGNVPLTSIHIGNGNPDRSSYISMELPPALANGAASHYRSSSDYSLRPPPPRPMANFSRAVGDTMTRKGPTHKSTKSDSTGLKVNRPAAGDVSSDQSKKPKPTLTKLITDL